MSKLQTDLVLPNKSRTRRRSVLVLKLEAAEIASVMLEKQEPTTTSFVEY